MKKNIVNGYLMSIQGTEDDPEYLRLKSIINKRPQDEEGYEWMLNADTLEWEGVKIEDSEEQEDVQVSPSESK